MQNKLTFILKYSMYGISILGVVYEYLTESYKFLSTVRILVEGKFSKTTEINIIIILDILL